MKRVLNLLPVNIRRQYLLKKAQEGSFKNYLSQPIPSPAAEVSAVEFIVLDFETTGLNPETNAILSVGYTVIKNNRVIMQQNGYHIVHQQNELQSDNVVIHQITDTVARSGIELKTAIDDLLEKMAGRVLVAHHAAIEVGFLNAACRQLYGHPIPLRVIDTLLLEKKRLQRRHSALKPNQLRLFNIRKAYELPRYKAHNALEDAIATAELFLAMVAKYCGDEKCRLKLFLQ